jgi:hypothetical protein
MAPRLPRQQLTVVMDYCNLISITVFMPSFAEGKPQESEKTWKNMQWYVSRSCLPLID